MVQVPRLISRRMSATSGSLLFTFTFLVSCSAKPNFCANRYMMVWSGLDSHSGSITFSRHWIERFDAVQEPSVSNWVAAGSR